MSNNIFEVEERPHERSLRDLYFVFFRHKWKAILFFLVLTPTVAIFTIISDDVYRSEAKLFVRVGRETVTLDPTATTGTIVPVSQSRESEIGTELEILKSTEIVSKVVDSVGLEPFISSSDKQPEQGLSGRLNLSKQVDVREAVLLEVMEKFEVEVQKNSWIVNLAYEEKSPELAQQEVCNFL